MYKILVRLPLKLNGWIPVCVVVIIYTVLDTFGLLIHFLEKDFFTEFSYPYNGDIQNYIGQLRMNITPDVNPINYYNYTIENNPKTKCVASTKSNTIKLVYLIKSAVIHVKNRNAIRKTWGYEKRFSDVEIRTVFLIGKSYSIDWDQQVIAEADKYRDIIIINYYDDYYNNTIKTMMGFKWTVTTCPNAQFYMFVDDDYYVSTKNVLRYIRNPTEYPEYIKPFLMPISSKTGRTSNVIDIYKRHPLMFLDNFDLTPEVRLYSGYVFQTSPHRHKLSKWYIPLEEYPYHLWPPYASAGAYILSKESLLDLFYASYYTKHFRFDDIYVGLLALKTRIEPLHCKEFYYHKKNIKNAKFEFTIASHGYENPDELLSVWNTQRELGNA